MNNDMKIINSDWLTELAQWTLLPEIGIVGPKLIYENGRVQHAGVILGLNGIAGHLYQYAPKDFFGLFGSTNWYHNFSAVTGACQMMRRQVYDELGGYHEGYQLTFSDVDLCISAISQNYRILYNPFSVIVHSQGKSRGYYSPDHDVELARIRMKKFLDNRDQYFSNNLTLDNIPVISRKYYSNLIKSNFTD